MDFLRLEAGADHLRRAVYLCETFAEYNARTGQTNGNGLVQQSWVSVQAQMEADSLAAYARATNDLALGHTNVVLPPLYKAKPIPPLLKNLGAN